MKLFDRDTESSLPRSVYEVIRACLLDHWTQDERERILRKFPDIGKDSLRGFVNRHKKYRNPTVAMLERFELVCKYVHPGFPESYINKFITDEDTTADDSDEQHI